MSVVTTADEKIYSAKEHIKGAIDDLTKIFVDEVWGSDEFSQEYREKYRKAWLDLIAMRENVR